MKELWGERCEAPRLGQCCLTELSAMTEMFCVCAVHCDSHEPQVGTEDLDETGVNRGADF